MLRTIANVLIVPSAVLVLGLPADTGAAVRAASTESQASSSRGLYSKAQSDRGKAAYGLNCAACHGNDLTGDPAMQSPSLAGDDFLKSWTAKSVDDLFDKIRTTMPANSPGSVPEDQV